MIEALSISSPVVEAPPVRPKLVAPPAAPRPIRPRLLGEVLIEAGVIDAKGVARAMEVQKKSGGRLGSVLVILGLCSEHQIREALYDQLGVEVVDLGLMEPDREALDLLPIEMIRRYGVVPLKLDGNRLWVAMMDPYNLAAIDDIRFSTGRSRLIINACTEGDFRRFIAHHLETRTVIDEILAGEDFYKRALEFVGSGLEDDALRTAEKEEEESPSEESVHELQLASEQSPIITLCNFIFIEAIHRRASDIHVEPYEAFLRVRIRVDGQLRTLLSPPKRLHGAMLTRLKVMSGLDIANRRIPQDGHLAVRYQGKLEHLRVSTLPTVYGEKCVLRLLKKDPELLSIDRIGFSPEDLAVFKTTLSAPQGLILVTGPTGSGKTTTLYSGLGFINDGEKNIVTLEDPVESSLAGINHVPIHERGGVTFASGLRSILRQDPDVIFVGEMRDSEVCSIALRAALTGHLVLSTLHTNSAVESLARLDDLEVPPYLLAATLLMVVAQRLLRRVCPACAEPAEASPEDTVALGLGPELLAPARLRRGRGCSRCLQTGYYGRFAVYEILRVNRVIRELIHRRAPAPEILEAARETGWTPLLEAGVARALQGETTLAEVRRVLFQVE
jgi:type IV pilus assembly protein PilB